MLSYINVEAGQTCAEELGDQSAFVEADLSGEAGAEAMVKATVDRFDRLDIAINGAGIGTLAPIVDQTGEQWDNILDLNLRGVFLSTKHEARQMVAQGDGGAMVNIASINAQQASEGKSAYCSSKACVEMLRKV